MFSIQIFLILCSSPVSRFYLHLFECRLHWSLKSTLQFMRFQRDRTDQQKWKSNNAGIYFLIGSMPWVKFNPETSICTFMENSEVSEGVNSLPFLSHFQRAPYLVRITLDRFSFASLEGSHRIYPSRVVLSRSWGFGHVFQKTSICMLLVVPDPN